MADRRKGRVLGLELRRSTAPVAGALALVLGLLSMLYLFGGLSSPFGQWNGFTGALRNSLEVLCPVALAAGAWQGRREAQPGAAELISTTARPTWQRVVPVAGALAITLTAAFLVLFVFGAVQVAANTSYQHLGWLPMLLAGELSLIAAGWLGLGIGTVAPSAFTAPMLAVFGLVILRFLAYGVDGQASLLGPGLTFRDDFRDLAPQVTWAQLLWFAGLAVGGLVLTMATGRRRYLAVLAIGLGLAGSLPLFPANQAATYVTDPAAVAPVCTSDAPRVCVTQAHADALADVTDPAREALRLLAPLADAPTSVMEDTSSPYEPEVKSQPSEVLLFALNSYELDEHSHVTLPRDELLNRMLEGAGTVSCGDPSQPPPELSRAEDERRERQFAARELAVALLLGKPVPLFNTRASQAWPALHALPAAEQQRRLSALRAASLSCQSDSLRILTQGATG